MVNQSISQSNYVNQNKSVNLTQTNLTYQVRSIEQNYISYINQIKKSFINTLIAQSINQSIKKCLSR